MNFKRTLNVGGVLLLIALVVPFAIYAVPMTVGADHSFVVLTASMTPAIAPGDVVIVADRDPETIVEGDVITFTRGTNEVPVTHRVTTVVEGVDGVAFETKGDANSDIDASFVPADNVIGTVILTIPYIGYVVQFTNTPYGFVALVALPIGLFVVSELWMLFQRRSITVGPDGEFAERETTHGTPDDTASSDASAGDVNEFMITTRTLEGAFAPLVALTLYSGYIATVRLTEITIAVAVGSTISLVALSILLVTARRRNGDAPMSAEPEPERSESERPAADGGIVSGSPVSGPLPDADGDGSVDE
ncbi:signal peptidase I [Halopenitus sp. H-Gu1]|uniref:signal peptidase I n=1 Tax=Halopenitus sp. H-Gu1 TaxID=3242697 RepID=UPI00359EE696